MFYNWYTPGVESQGVAIGAFDLTLRSDFLILIFFFLFWVGAVRTKLRIRVVKEFV
jgi:hypothetical protein